MIPKVKRVEISEEEGPIKKAPKKKVKRTDFQKRQASLLGLVITKANGEKLYEAPEDVDDHLNDDDDDEGTEDNE